MNGIFEWRGNKLLCNSVEVARAVGGRGLFKYWYAEYLRGRARGPYLSARRAKVAIEKRFNIASL